MPFDNPHQTSFGDLDVLEAARSRIFTQDRWIKRRFQVGERLCVVAALSLAARSRNFCLPNRTKRRLTRLLAAELAPGVRVNGIAPGVVETDDLKAVLTDELRAQIISATPLRRLSTVADVANAARWLASPAASYVTGKIIEIDGGAAAPTFPDDTPDLHASKDR